MKVFFEPKVYLLGRPQLDDSELERFLGDHGVLQNWTPGANGATSDAETIPEVAGRVCYMSFEKPRPGGNKGYLHRILESGHGSVVEHTNFNFLFTQVSRTLTHELVRHRAGWAYSQLSQRYVDESTCEVVCPYDLRNEVSEALGVVKSQPWERAATARDVEDLLHLTVINDPKGGTKRVAGLMWLASNLTGFERYVSLVNYLSDRAKSRDYASFLAHPANETETAAFDSWWNSRPQDYKTAVRKEARQAARSVLPNACETKIFCTANVRAIRHFIEMRCSRHAEPEVRRLAAAVLRLMKGAAPHLFADYEFVSLPDGTEEAFTVYRKV